MHTEIFPYFNNFANSPPNLTYMLANLDATYGVGVTQALINTLIGNLVNICSYRSTSSIGNVRYVQFDCNDFITLHFCPKNAANCHDSNNLVTNVMARLWNSYSYFDYIYNEFQSLVIGYHVKDPSKNIGLTKQPVPGGQTQVALRPHTVDFTAFFNNKRQENLKIFTDIYNALRNYSISKRMTESLATSPNGMIESDDYWVPWVYQVTASSLANTQTACSSDTCANLQSTNFFARNSPPNYGDTMFKVVNYLLGGDRQYFTDAFGNPLVIELLVLPNSTSLRSFINAPAAAPYWLPPYPQKNYLNVLNSQGLPKPPFWGYVYSAFCTNLTNAQLSTCRVPIVYVN